jgi:hypothetical protein
MVSAHSSSLRAIGMPACRRLDHGLGGAVDGR